MVDAVIKHDLHGCTLEDLMQQIRDAKTEVRSSDLQLTFKDTIPHPSTSKVNISDLERASEADFHAKTPDEKSQNKGENEDQHTSESKYLSHIASEQTEKNMTLLKFLQNYQLRSHGFCKGKLFQ